VDVNGSRFHGILSEIAWRACRLDGQPVSIDAWPGPSEATGDWLRVEWNAGEAALTLRRLPRRAAPSHAPVLPLGLEARRGAGQDGRGNWYWIAADQTGVLWQPAGGGPPVPFWPITPIPCRPSDPAGFAPVPEPSLSPARFAGLTVTTAHYLVVGEVGVLHLFDLEAGGPPTTLQLDPSFDPFDMAPLADGGVAVLDRANRALWILDRHFAVVLPPLGLPLDAPATDFAAEDGLPSLPPATCPPPRGFALWDFADPVAVEALPHGRLLVFDAPAAEGDSSTLTVQALDMVVAGPIPLPDLPGEGGPLVAHDIAVSADADGRLVLYVLDGAARQAFAFLIDLDTSPPTLEPLPDYLPLHQPGGRGLVGGPGGPFYDVTIGGEDARTSWVRLTALDQPRYATDAALETPVFHTAARGAIWHRVFLDACLPPDTTLRVLARAHDDQALLAEMPYRSQPLPYRRALGPEIPFLPVPPGKEATFETLLQDLRGRHAQIRIEIAGNGRVSPRLRRLRIYAPRFSYVEHYLPALYRDDLASASFLERMLANMEGLLTQIEGSIADVRALLDPVGAPAEALDWLAGWLGLVLDPIWSTTTSGAEDRRRLLIRCAPLLFERRGTVAGLRFALLLYLDPCLPALMRRIDAAATMEDTVLRQALAAFGLPYPTRSDGALAQQALFFAYVATADRPSSVRLVEHFMTRGGRGLVAGLPAMAAEALEDTAEALAHGFTVLVPEGLSADDAAMVERIIELEKPAHTAFTLRRYVDALRVGEARVGVDTIVGFGARFTALTLGVTPLAAGWLSSPHPFGIRNRLIAGRDRLGRLPPL
jgi:phage tail-like protein